MPVRTALSLTSKMEEGREWSLCWDRRPIHPMEALIWMEVGGGDCSHAGGQGKRGHQAARQACTATMAPNGSPEIRNNRQEEKQLLGTRKIFPN